MIVVIAVGLFSSMPTEKESANISSQECSGTARCITGTVTSVIDGDTIKVDGQSIRFALSSAPEMNEFNGPESREFIQEICPVGSIVLVDEDDGQTEGSYGRIVGVIYCNGVNLNEELVDSGLGYLSTGFCIEVSLQVMLGLSNMDANYAELGSFFNLKLLIYC